MNGTKREKDSTRMAHSVLVTAAFALFLSLLMAGTVTATHDSKPVAVIDGTLRVAAGQTVFLDGTFSNDAGANALAYLWTLDSLPEGSIAQIVDRTDAHAKFDADVPGIYRVRLVVNNGLVESDPVIAIVVIAP